MASTLERVVGADTYIFSYLRLKDGSFYQTFHRCYGAEKKRNGVAAIEAALDYSSVGL